MKLDELIHRLQQKKVKFYLQEGKLILDAPKDTVDPRLLSGVKEHKAEFISFLAENKQEQSTHNELSFNKVPRDHHNPLSYAQRRMMILHSMQDNESAFNHSIVYEIDDILDIEKLNRSLRLILSESELLRTRFVWQEERPVQIIEDETKIEVKQIDISPHGKQTDDDLSLQAVGDEIEKPFDISSAPILRAVLIKRQDRKSLLALITHYLVADQESLLTIARHLAQYYSQIVMESSCQETQHFQYLDYVAWEQSFLAGKSGHQLLQKWIKKQGELGSYGKIVQSHEMAISRFHNTDHIEFFISVEETELLNDQFRETGISLSILLYTIYVIVISKFSAGSSFFCSMPIANRSRIETEKMLGYFANTLVIYNEIDLLKTFVEQVSLTRAEVLYAMESGDIPFDYALEASGLDAQLFNRFMFNFSEQTQTSLSFGRVVARQLDFYVPMAHNSVNELSFSIERSENEIRCCLDYALETIESSTAKMIVSDFQTCLSRTAIDPQIGVDELLRLCKAVYDISTRIPNRISSTVSAINKAGDSNQPFKAPGNDLEEMIAKIWMDVLGLSEVSVSESFFALGGNSFKAVRIFAELQKQTGLRLPLASILRSPTIELLAQQLQINDKGNWSPLVLMQSEGSNAPLFFIHGAGGNVLLYRDLARYLGNGRPFYGVQAVGLDGKSELLTSVEEMAQHYVREIQKVQKNGPYFLGGYCLGGQIAYEMARILRVSGEQVTFVGLLDTQRSWMHKTNLRTRIHHQYQQIAFHFKNLLLADFIGKKIFIKEKRIELWKRIKNQSSYLFSTFLYKIGLLHDRPFQLIEKVNDKAAFSYEALPYDGKIHVFTPKQNYSGYDDRFMGWSGVAKEIEIVNLSMYPAGMLLEPFVKELAEKITFCLNEGNE